MDIVKDKAEVISNQINRITEKLNLADDLTVTGDDIIDYVKEKTESVDVLIPENNIDLLNLQNLIEDFKYVRNVLRENTEAGRKIISIVSGSIMDIDLEGSPALITSFAELNRTLTDNMKLYVQSYKEISNIIINLNKAKSIVEPQQKISNNLNITNIVDSPQNMVLSTADLIKRLKDDNKEKEK